MTVRPPEDSPGSLSAIGNDEALRMEGFFAAYRTFWNAPRVAKGRTAPKHPPFLIEGRGKPC